MRRREEEGVEEEKLVERSSGGKWSLTSRVRRMEDVKKKVDCASMFSRQGGNEERSGSQRETDACRVSKPR